jgi:hypothetical protein
VRFPFFFTHTIIKIMLSLNFANLEFRKLIFVTTIAALKLRNINPSKNDDIG